MKTVHIALDDVGLEGQWVDVKDPHFLTMRTLTRWQAEIKDGTLDNERFIREFVAAWHLVDPDMGSEMNDPLKDDVGGLTVAVFQAINENLQRLFRGGASAAGSGGPDRGLPDGDPGSAKPAA